MVDPNKVLKYVATAIVGIILLGVAAFVGYHAYLERKYGVVHDEDRYPPGYRRGP